MRHDTRRRRGESGLSAGVGLVAMTIGLALVAVLFLLGTNVFGGATAPGTSSVISTSSAETQLKLCAEGRPSSYGDPPTQAQQAKCLDQLAGQLGGGLGGTGAP